MLAEGIYEQMIVYMFCFSFSGSLVHDETAKLGLSLWILPFVLHITDPGVLCKPPDVRVDHCDAHSLCCQRFRKVKIKNQTALYRFSFLVILMFLSSVFQDKNHIEGNIYPTVHLCRHSLSYLQQHRLDLNEAYLDEMQK